MVKYLSKVANQEKKSSRDFFLDRQLKTKQVLLPGQVKRKDGSWVGERQVVVSLWE